MPIITVDTASAAVPDDTVRVVARFISVPTGAPASELGPVVAGDISSGSVDLALADGHWQIDLLRADLTGLIAWRFVKVDGVDADVTTLAWWPTVDLARIDAAAAASGGGGAAPAPVAVLQRASRTTAQAPTSPQTFDFETSDIMDAGYSYGSGGEVTIGADLDGRRAVVDVQLTVFYTNRSEVRVQLQRHDGSGWETVRSAHNYATRDSNQNQGGSTINGHVVSLVAGERWRVLGAVEVDGPGPRSWSSTGCWLTIRTID